MKPILKSVIGVSCATFMAVGCTDDKYDLSDLDKDIQLKVNDLTVSPSRVYLILKRATVSRKLMESMRS